MNVILKPAADELVLTRDLDGAARAGVRRLDRRPPGVALVGAAGLHDAVLRDGCAAGRRLAPPHARARTAPSSPSTASIARSSPPERLVFTYITEYADGIVDPETLVTVTFVDLGGRTRLTLRHAAFGTEASRVSHHGGWTGALERFAAFIAAN